MNEADNLPIQIVILPPSEDSVSRSFASIKQAAAAAGREIGQTMGKSMTPDKSAEAEFVAYQKRLAQSVTQAARMERAAGVEDAQRTSKQLLDIQKAQFASQVAQGQQWVAMNRAWDAAIAEDKRRASQQIATEQAQQYQAYMLAGNAQVAMNRAWDAAIAEDKRRASQQIATEQAQQYQAYVLAGNAQVAMNRAWDAAIAEDKRRTARLPTVGAAEEVNLRRMTLSHIQGLNEDARRTEMASAGAFFNRFAAMTWEWTRVVYGMTALAGAALGPAILGIKLQKDMEDARVGITGILVSMTNLNGKAMEFNDAWRISGTLVKEVQADSIKYGVQMEHIVNTFRSILAPGIGAGMSIAEIQKLASVGSVAVSAIGLPAQQMVQEIRDLVTGGIQPSQNTLATALGITGKDIAEIRRNGGDLFKFLMDRLQGFADVAAETRKNTLSGSWEIFMGKLSLALAADSGAFDALKEAIHGATKALDDPATKDAIAGYTKVLLGVGEALGMVVKGWGLLLSELDRKLPEMNIPGGWGTLIKLVELLPKATFVDTSNERPWKNKGVQNHFAPTAGKSATDVITQNDLSVLADINKDVTALHAKYETEAERHGKAVLDIETKYGRGITEQRFLAFKAYSAGDVKMFQEHQNSIAQLQKQRQSDIAMENAKDAAKDKYSPAMIAEAKLHKEAFQSSMKYVASLDSETKSIERKTEATILETEEIGKTKAEIDLLQAARYDHQTEIMKETLLTYESANACTVEAEALRDAIAAREAYKKAKMGQSDTQGLQDSLNAGEKAIDAALKANDTAMKKASEASKKFRENVQRDLGDVMYTGLQGKFSDIGDMFKKMLLRMAADAAAAKLTQYIFGLVGSSSKGAQSPLWGGSSSGFGDTGGSSGGSGSNAAMSGAAAYAGWIALAVVAVAAIIQRSGYDHGNKSAQDIQAVEATGQVFGDMLAKSATIAEVSKAIKLNSDESLIYSQGMLSALQQMTVGIDAFARTVIRVTPGAVNGMGFSGRLGITHDSSFNNPLMDDQGRGQVLSEFFPVLIAKMNKWVDDNDVAKNLIGKFSKKDISVTDAGLRLSGTVAELSQGHGVQQYMDSNTTTSSYWGLKKTTDANPRRFVGVGAEFADQFAKIFSSLSDVLTKAGGALGRDTAAISSIIARFPVDISVSLYRLKGQALSDELSRVLTTLSDTLVKTIFGDVLKYAHVGEDALTTLARVANETEMMSKALDRLGVKARPTTDALVGITQSLIDAAGGANTYFSQMDYFTKNFLTAAQQLVPVQNAVNKAFADLGMVVPATKDEFAKLMQSSVAMMASDLPSVVESGRALHVALLNIAPAFNSIATAAQDAKDKLMALIKTDSFKTMVDYQMFLARATAGVPQVPGFASGGDFGGGMRLVGENGPELEATGASRITSTRNLMSALQNPQSNNAVLVAAVNALRAEVAKLRASSESTARSTEKTQSLLRNVTRDGQSLLTSAA